ncbi:hypothetical protein IMZ48_01660 [Candidatus Bathyarchaeota archaeon]|nr:hypothetical protein [Candidatus Bathyarchaeota archaeon]
MYLIAASYTRPSRPTSDTTRTSQLTTTNRGAHLTTTPTLPAYCPGDTTPSLEPTTSPAPSASSPSERPLGFDAPLAHPERIPLMGAYLDSAGSAKGSLAWNWVSVQAMILRRKTPKEDLEAEGYGEEGEGCLKEEEYAACTLQYLMK